MGDRRLSNGVSCAAWLIIRDTTNPVCVCVCTCVCELMNSYVHRLTHTNKHNLTCLLSCFPEEEEEEEEAEADEDEDETCLCSSVSARRIRFA